MPHGSTRNRIGWAVMRGLRLWRHQGTHAFLNITWEANFVAERQ
jgi:hypothetical protein